MPRLLIQCMPSLRGRRRHRALGHGVRERHTAAGAKRNARDRRTIGPKCCCAPLWCAASRPAVGSSAVARLHHLGLARGCESLLSQSPYHVLGTLGGLVDAFSKLLPSSEDRLLVSFFSFFLNTKIKANAFVLMVEQGEGPALVRGACRPASPSFGGRVAWRGWLGGGRALCRRPRVDRGGVRAARRRLRRGRRGTPQAACGAGRMAPNATATPRSTAGASAAAMTGRGTADASLGGAVLSVFPAGLVFGTDTRGARRLLTVKVRAQPLRRPTAGARARWTPAVVAD